MAVSYSKISVFTLCPSKYRYKYILKLPGDDSGVAANRGSMLHELLEKYLLKETQELPAELVKWKKVLDKMVSDGVQTEVRLAVNSNLEPCDFDDETAWLRCIIDTLDIKVDFAEVGDFKTGKVRDYSSQLKFYALLVFLCYPEIMRVGTRIRFIDANKSEPGVMYTRKDIPELLAHWSSIIHRMTSSKVYSPNPSSMCKYCPYNRNAGGPCKWG